MTMKTEELVKLAGEITQGKWSSFLGETYKIRAGGMNIATMNFVTRLDRLPERQVSANARAIALVPDLLAEVIKLRGELAAEKALADRLYVELQHSGVLASLGMIDYRKARGL